MKAKALALTILPALFLLAATACGSGAAGIGGGSMPDEEFALAFCLVVFDQDYRGFATNNSRYQLRGNWEQERQTVESELKKLQALSPSSKFEDYYEAYVARTEFWKEYAEGQPPENNEKRATWHDITRDPETESQYDEFIDEILRTRAGLSGEAMITLTGYNCSL